MAFIMWVVVVGIGDGGAGVAKGRSGAESMAGLLECHIPRCSACMLQFTAQPMCGSHAVHRMRRCSAVR